jgi:primosomal protein N' (replication factor Y)
VIFAIKKRSDLPNQKLKNIHHRLYESLLTKEQLDLARWVSSYYGSGIGIVLNLFLKQTTAERVVSKIDDNWLSKQDLLKNKESTVEFKIKDLNDSQLEAIKSSTSEYSSKIMLFGQTGSGKTEVYLRVALDTLKNKKNVLTLVPEINLTAQNISRFSELGYEIIEVHSAITDVMRARLWQKIKLFNHLNINYIILGTRSALFLPFQNIGLIVVDEFHDSSYKNNNEPKYNAFYVANKLAEIFQPCRLILGSATPPVTEMKLWQDRGNTVIEMESRLGQKTDFEVITMNPNDGILVKASKEAIESVIVNNGQILIYLNRRGYSRMQVCRECGWSLKCDHCGRDMVFHDDAYSMKCHTCLRESKPQIACPDCGSLELVFGGTGTKKVVDEVSKLFKNTRIARFDADNTKKGEKLNNRLLEIKNNEIDILVGTQMLAKGLDLPNLELVIVLNAEMDSGNLDYLSTEKAVSNLIQVCGRVGRGHKHGKVILQTYSDLEKNNTSSERNADWLDYVINNDYYGFYNYELKKRLMENKPPFSFMIKITGKFKNRNQAQIKLKNLIKYIQKSFDGLQIIGPSPLLNEKAGEKVNWGITIVGKKRDILLELKLVLSLDKEFSNLNSELEF